MKNINDTINNSINGAINARLQQISNIQFPSISKIQTIQITNPILNLPKYDFFITTQWLDSIRSSMDVYTNKLKKLII